MSEQLSLLNPGEPDPSFRKHGGNRESVDAFQSIAPSLNARREKVLSFIQSKGSFGATTDEVSAHFNVPPNAVSGRISDLSKSGDIVPTGNRRPTRSGCTARVFKAAIKRQYE